MLVVYLYFIHPFEVYKERAFHMGMRAWSVEPRAVGDVWYLIAAASLDDSLHFLGRARHSDAGGYRRHYPLVSQAAFIPAGPRAVSLAHGGVFRYILGADD